MSGGIRYEETAVALQGTIDSFPLIDVLALLEASAKTGRLEVVGDRGRGILWVHNGELIAAEVHGSVEVDATDAVWELLRFNDGSFEFGAGDEPPTRSFTAEIAATVTAARKMLAKWERITEKVPTLNHRVTLAEHLPGEDVRLSADDWSVLVAAGPSRSVREVLDVLGASEFSGCAKLAELVDRFLVEVHEPLGIAEQTLVDHEPSESTVQEGAAAASVSVSAIEAEPAEVAATVEALVAQGAPSDASELDDMPISQRFTEAPEEPQETPPEEVVDPAPDPQVGQVAQPEPVAHAGVSEVPVPEEPMARGSAEVETTRFPEHFPIDDLVSDDEGVGWEQAMDSPQGNDAAQGHPVPQGSPGVGGAEPPLQPETTMPAANGQAAAAAEPLMTQGVPLVPADPVAAVPQQNQAPAADPFAVPSNGNGEQADASEDVLSQISRLSPKAAEAIAAALGDEGA